MTAPIELVGVFDDPAVVRRLVETTGPYPSIASYLPASATQPVPGAGSGPLPWFRSNWAANGRLDVAGAEVVLHNPKFVDAASRLFDGAEVRPTTIVVNVNAPMGPGAIHVDIPSFQGANRDTYSLRLLQAMGSSGLFEPWRIVEAGAITWFYDGPGGAYDYWPDGLDGPMCSRRPPFHNVAFVADNDRMYHRIGWIGEPNPITPALTPHAEISHDRSGRWTIRDDAATWSYPHESVRISILWKAQVITPTVAAPLTTDQIAAIITTDLAERGIEPLLSSDPTADSAWIDLVHGVYYPVITAPE